MLDPVSTKLEHYLSLLSQRQRLVASNIANADTPGYRTRDIDFDAELSNALIGSPANAKEVGGLSVKNDGNNVDLDRESRLLAENALRFNVAANLIHSKMKLLKTAISGGTSL